MRLKFTKMQGAGNDFVVLDCTRAPFALAPAQIRRLADRRFGVGCDQVLVVEPAPAPDVDFGYRIFNADGGEVEACGNGARCFARFVREKGLSAKRELRVATAAGVIRPRLEDDGEVSVDMGPPAPAVPLVQEIELDGERVRLALVAMGNPHAVQVVADIERAPVREQGPRIERHARFPRGVNAGYMQVLGRNAIALRVWERGAGETLACGTGACAAAVAGILQGLLESPVTVRARGGTLTVSWPGGDNPVRMKGPAETVFEGEIELAEGR
ncbi:MAG: diaminopimelate epimerase [Burkholderiales bacterium]|nr:diaminopimelate epimerase [Burkholderiales bacterium]